MKTFKLMSARLLVVMSMIGCGGGRAARSRVVVSRRHRHRSSSRRTRRRARSSPSARFDRCAQGLPGRARVLRHHRQGGRVE